MTKPVEIKADDLEELKVYNLTMRRVGLAVFSEQDRVKAARTGLIYANDTFMVLQKSVRDFVSEQHTKDNVVDSATKIVASVVDSTTLKIICLNRELIGYIRIEKGLYETYKFQEVLEK